MSETAPGIRQKGVDLTTRYGRIKLVHAFRRRKIAPSLRIKVAAFSISGSSAAIRRS